MPMAEHRCSGLDEAALGRCAAVMAVRLEPGTVLWLQGELGAGKTTFMRALLRALGWQGPVKSPTYTLVESYPLPPFTLHHFDLYRLADPEELAFAGIRDYADGQAVLGIEWPDKGAGFLPPADLVLQVRGTGLQRELLATALSSRGEGLVQALAAFDATGGTR